MTGVYTLPVLDLSPSVTRYGISSSIDMGRKNVMGEFMERT